MTDNVFVYGTLLRGEERACVIRELGASAILLAESWGSLLDLGPYPGLVLDTQDAVVQGEFVKFGDIQRALATLDAIEGFVAPGSPDNLYERKRVEVGMCDGRVREAWTYVYAGDATDAMKIETGDWRASRGRRDGLFEALAVRHAQGLAIEAIAMHLRRRRQFECVEISSVADLERMLRDGTMSERQLAQATGRWAVSLE